MLEFIVLGEVPGTQLIITFTWVLAVSSFIIGTVLARRLHKQRLTKDARSTDLIDQITL